MASSNHEDDPLLAKIVKIFNESSASYATHKRKLKELSRLRSSSPHETFLASFTKSLTPLLNFQRRTASTERVVRFVAIFCGIRDSDCNNSWDVFLEEVLKFLVTAASAANKAVRFRACQLISEIIMRFPDDAEVSDELWDEVIDSMKLRMGDKFPIIRTFSVRALSRFVNDSENSDILDLFLEALAMEQNADVRKTIILSLPASNLTSQAIVDCGLDVNESVRRAAYIVLANKFPIQSLSIKHRTVILQRGLSDRSPAVVKECLKLMKDEWLAKHCKSDPIELLKFLDVETYETIGDSVMGALLCAGVIDLHDGQSACQFMGLTSTEAVGDGCASSQLLDPEVALYWRSICKHLQAEAQAKGSDAASTTGTEAAIYAAEASDNNDLLEKFLPATVSQYVKLAKGLLAAGPNYRFTSRQLLLLGAMLDFSDATNRRVAGAFVQDLLMRPLEYELDHDGNMIVIGDGINLGGDKDWAFAVSELAKKVHASGGEFEEVLLGVIGELAQPCRERTADCIQWMHCLAVTGLLLENVKSFHQLQGKAIEPAELLHSLLLPGAKHLNLDVQRVAVQCLGLYGLLERRPSEELLKQLRVSFVKGPCPISFLAGKALMDLVMWHGPQEVDKSYGLNLPLQDNVVATVAPIDFSGTSGDLDSGVLDLLHAALANENWNQLENLEEDELVQAMLGEGFAKILLLSDKYPSINCSLHTSVLVKLITLYFIEETKELNRLKQCLSVFFEHYPSLSTNHKKHLSQAFIPVVRGMWPGINGNPKESSVTVSNMRKRAVQVSLFMVQMMQSPLYAKVTGNSITDLPETEDGSVENIDDFENGEEGLAIRIAAEVASFPAKKTQAEKSYVSALCKSLVQLRFRPSEQGAIKLMRYLLHRLANTLSSERELVKEFKNMAEYLRKMDSQPDQEILPDQAGIIFGGLGLENPGPENSMEVPPTPAPRSTRSARPRRRRHEETSSDEESSRPQIIMPAAVVGLSSGRSQRASKLAALSKLTTHRTAVAHDHIDEEEEGSDLTSEDESAELD